MTSSAPPLDHTKNQIEVMPIKKLLKNFIKKWLFCVVTGDKIAIMRALEESEFVANEFNLYGVMIMNANCCRIYTKIYFN